MRCLKATGLYSLPSGDIFDDVRKRVSTKCATDEWLGVMRAVHAVGLRSTGTMMFSIGADDMGSIMIEENVVSVAGTDTQTNKKELRYQISKPGFVLKHRDILYEYVNRENI